MRLQTLNLTLTLTLTLTLKLTLILHLSLKIYGHSRFLDARVFTSDVNMFEVTLRYISRSLRLP